MTYSTCVVVSPPPSRDSCIDLRYSENEIIIDHQIKTFSNGVCTHSASSSRVCMLKSRRRLARDPYGGNKIYIDLLTVAHSHADTSRK